MKARYHVTQATFTVHVDSDNQHVPGKINCPMSMYLGFIDETEAEAKRIIQSTMNTQNINHPYEWEPNGYLCLCRSKQVEDFHTGAKSTSYSCVSLSLECDTSDMRCYPFTLSTRLD